MNYLRELNAFDVWLQTNPIPAESIALWFALMRIANSAGWPEEFTVANGTLQNKAGLSAGQLKRHRNKLAEVGLIRYVKSESANQVGKYKMVPISQNEPQDKLLYELQNAPQSDSQNALQENEPLNKLQNGLQGNPQGGPLGAEPITNSEGRAGTKERNPLRFDPPS